MAALAQKSTNSDFWKSVQCIQLEHSHTAVFPTGGVGHLVRSTLPMLQIGRRHALTGAFATTLAGPEPALLDDPDSRALWSSFKSRFITDDGRVVDTANKNVSHTEGQGWGLLFAVSFDDVKTFATIFDWTSRTLRRPHDQLHAWRYVPDATPAVGDLNNATDGDIFIAAALGRAASRWGRDDYAQLSAAISHDILLRLVQSVGDRLVLLPAAAGFQKPDAVVINMSYYAFPLLAELARLAPSPQWARLADDGCALLASGRFGTWQLPPDWLLVTKDGHLQPASGWPPRFSYDAIRIPLWLVWSRLMSDQVYQALHGFWISLSGSGQSGPGQPEIKVPAWTDLATNEIAPYPASPGILAVARLTEAAAGGTAPDLPPIGTATTYYDAALILLTHLAARERGA